MGYIHIYTGDGKGKTTAAIGLAVRSLYAGKKVYMGQFVKSRRYFECGLEKDFENFKIEQYGEDCFIFREPTPNDIIMAKNGLEKIDDMLSSGVYDVVIFDEIFIALYYHLITEEEVLEILNRRPEHTEVVLTGRYAPPSLIEYADLVTEMKEIKHYFQRGVQARDGIER